MKLDCKFILPFLICAVLLLVCSVSASNLTQYNSNLTMLLHMDGSQSGTIFTNEIGNTMIPAGTVNTDTTNKKFGNASANFTSSGDYISTFGGPINVGTGNWTFIAWTYRSPSASGYKRIISNGVGSTLLRYQVAESNWYCVLNSIPVFEGGSGVTSGAWHQSALIKNGTSVLFYEDGIPMSSGSTSVNMSFTYSNPFFISSNVTNQHWHGGIDELAMWNVAININDIWPQTTPIDYGTSSITSNFMSNVTSGLEPLPVQFTDTSTTISAKIDTWNWSFGDGNVSSLQNPEHTFLNNGSYSVNLTITNTSLSLESTKLASIVVYNQPPVANFTMSNQTGLPPLVVQFTDTSTGDGITAWNWSFGEGNVSSLQNPLHIYDVIGEHQVNLTVTNDGGSSTKLQNITVVLFASNFSSDKTTGEIPMTVQFTDTSDVFGSSIDEWHWDFGDGTTSVDQNPLHTYITPSLYSVNLTIINNSLSISSTKFMNIEVFEESFETDFLASPYTYTNVNNILNFNATVSSGTANGWLWDFEGGTDIDATTISASHTYTTVGNYSVNFTVYNDIGAYSLIKPNYIRVFGPGMPYAQFSALTTTGTPGAFISFIDQSLYGTPNGLVCNWSFGDSVYTISPYSSECGDVGHVYTYAGVYDVSLNITNSNGTSVETKKQYIRISTIQQTQTTFYTPRTIQLHITDVYGNSLIGATVSANFNETTLPDGWLVSNFGMNEIAANQAMNGTLIMSGFSSTTGDVGFVMNSAIGYDVTVSYGGDTNSYFIYPTSSIYNLRFIPSSPTTTTTTDLFADGKTKTWFTTPDVYNVTLWWSFQDSSGLTSMVEYFVVDFADNSTILFNYTLNSPGTSQYLLNWTEPNIRGNQRIWYMNITRSV